MDRTSQLLPFGRRLAVAEAFAHVLGNTSCLQRVALSYEWNVRGPLAAAAAMLFHRQAEEMFWAQGLIACRIRLMGEVAMPDESDLVLSVPDQAACRDTPGAEVLVRILARGHERTIVSIHAASDVALDVDDRGSLVILDSRLLAHEAHLAQLVAFLR